MKSYPPRIPGRPRPHPIRALYCLAALLAWNCGNNETSPDFPSAFSALYFKSEHYEVGDTFDQELRLLAPIRWPEAAKLFHEAWRGDPRAGLALQRLYEHKGFPTAAALFALASRNAINVPDLLPAWSQLGGASELYSDLEGEVARAAFRGDCARAVGLAQPVVLDSEVGPSLQLLVEWAHAVVCSSSRASRDLHFANLEAAVRIYSSLVAEARVIPTMYANDQLSAWTQLSGALSELEQPALASAALSLGLQLSPKAEPSRTRQIERRARYLRKKADRARDTPG